VKWLGFDWNGDVRHASSYFGQLYDWAIQLIKQGDAYVDLQSVEEIRLNRGDFNQAGTDSPFRNHTVEENLALFAKMKMVSLKRVPQYSVQKLTWQVQMFTCVIPCCIAF